MNLTMEEITAVIPLAVLEKLVQGGLFDTRNGSVTVHFDNDGTIRKMERSYVSLKC